MENEPQPKNPDEEKASDLLAAWHDYRDFIDEHKASVRQMKQTRFTLPYVINQAPMGIRSLPDVDMTPYLLIDIEKSLEVEHKVERRDDAGGAETLLLRVVSNKAGEEMRLLDRFQLEVDAENGALLNVSKGKADIDMVQGLINGARDYAEFVELKN